MTTSPMIGNMNHGPNHGPHTGMAPSYERETSLVASTLHRWTAFQTALSASQ
jgi:hypothetical protein